jgi:Spy/CpxP family protein refolding chaperone
MKLKKLPLLAGAIAVAFSITPLAANAQVKNSNAPQRVSQAAPQSSPNIELSPQQLQGIQKIREQTRVQIQAVLTKAQREQIQRDLQAGKQPQQVFASIQFTNDQQKKLRDIMVNSQVQTENLLTPEQKQELQKWRASQRRQAPKK